MRCGWYPVPAVEVGCMITIVETVVDLGLLKPLVEVAQYSLDTTIMR